MINDESGNRENVEDGAIPMVSKELAIEQLLMELAQNCRADFLLLADDSGRVIATLGKKPAADLTALGVLVAGDLMTSHEIARMTGQYQKNQMILREGSQVNIFVTEVGANKALLVQISKEVPLGWARLLIRETSIQLSKIFPANQEAVRNLDLGLSEGKISRMVSDDLDSIWKA